MGRCGIKGRPEADQFVGGQPGQQRRRCARPGEYVSTCVDKALGPLAGVLVTPSSSSSVGPWDKARGRRRGRWQHRQDAGRRRRELGDSKYPGRHDHRRDHHHRSCRRRAPICAAPRPLSLRRPLPSRTRSRPAPPLLLPSASRPLPPPIGPPPVATPCVRNRRGASPCPKAAASPRRRRPPPKLKPKPEPQRGSRTASFERGRQIAACQRVRWRCLRLQRRLF